MAIQESRVPMTLRSYFFQDPFFQTSWDGFDSLRKEMSKESTDFWKSVEKDMRQMESSMSSMMSSSSSFSSEKKESSSSSSTDKTLATTESSDSPWYFPRRWVLPKLFTDDSALDTNMKSLDLFQHNDDQVIRIKDDDSKFEVTLDIQNFQPEEIKVKVQNRLLSVEAKHEKKTENSFVSRSFSKSYTLPEGCEADKVESNLSKENILVISAPKKPALKSAGATKIPVEHKN